MGKRGRKPTFDSVREAIIRIYAEKPDKRRAQIYCRNHGLKKSDIDRELKEYDSEISQQPEKPKSKRGRKSNFNSLDNAISIIYFERSDGVSTKRGKQAISYCYSNGLKSADINKRVDDHKSKIESVEKSKSGRGRPPLYVSKEDAHEAWENADDKERKKIVRYAYKKFDIPDDYFPEDITKQKPRKGHESRIDLKEGEPLSRLYYSTPVGEKQLEKECNDNYFSLRDKGMTTKGRLTKAIANSITTHQIKLEDAERMADHMLNFFGFSDRIIDNILQPDDRDVFYIMEDCGILTTEREETTLYDGRFWRINYWLLKTNKINELIEDGPAKKKKDKNEDTVYDELPEEVWEH